MKKKINWIFQHKSFLHQGNIFNITLKILLNLRKQWMLEKRHWSRNKISSIKKNGLFI